ncbi:S41 family peptidase [Microbacterium sp. CIAB417]|uniref:S41 family peptidase n=1 Tax=Microbacterium sp. CIAB417 TaxID=2860287 RepID=UPI001FABD6F8|nr:S41 family peptidase [Microbacterium sp. CIAB417]
MVTTVTLGALAGAVVAAVFAADVYGPRFGFYLVPPSVEKYAQLAVERLDGGYHANDPEWPAKRAAILDAARSASEYAELYPLLQEGTQIAGGRHSSFVPAGTGSAAAESSAQPTVDTDAGVTTIVLPEMVSSRAEELQSYATTVADGIDRAAADTCGWVIDLRGNRGGNMYPMLSGIAALLPDGVALSFVDRGGNATAVTIEPRGAAIAGNVMVDVGAHEKLAGRPIAVLQDEWTASSGEAVLASFRGVEGARTFGADSAGYTSANVSRTLFDGATISLTESVYVDRTGRNYEEGPIAPDQTSTQDDADARAWLGEQGCVG